MSKAGIGLAAGAIVAILVVAILVFTNVAQTDPKSPHDPLASKCGNEPVDAVVVEKQFKVSGVNLEKFAIGDIQIWSKPEVFQALSTASRSLQVSEYLICAAEQRGEINPDDAQQLNYYRVMFLFMQTGPSSAEFQKWQKEHPFPKRAANLDLPDMEKAGNEWVLHFGAGDYEKEVRFIDTGKSNIKVWLSGFPAAVFFPIPNTGPWELTPDPAKTQRLQVLFLHVKAKKKEYPFQINVDGSDIINAKIVLETLAENSPYDALNLRLADVLKNPANNDAKPDALANLTTQIVDDKFPQLTEPAKDMVAWQVLTETSKPNAALVALKKVALKDPSSERNPTYLNLLADTYHATGDGVMERETIERSTQLKSLLPQ